MPKAAITLPEIGKAIDTTRALALCRYYGLESLVMRIQAHPEHYKSWIFDGASMVPDALFFRIFHIPHLIEIALRHDLKYAYGERGNHAEKHQADLEFKAELLADGADSVVAELMYQAVDWAGGEWLKADSSWGFASIHAG